jgi:hypothetical protein
VITLLGLYSRLGGQAAALSALVCGFLLTPLATYVLRLDAPFLSSIGGSLAAFAAGAVLAKKWASVAKLWPSKQRVRTQQANGRRV